MHHRVFRCYAMACIMCIFAMITIVPCGMLGAGRDAVLPAEILIFPLTFMAMTIVWLFIGLFVNLFYVDWGLRNEIFDAKGWKEFGRFHLLVIRTFAKAFRSAWYRGW